jgi:hypothetical protein
MQDLHAQRERKLAEGGQGQQESVNAVDVDAMGKVVREVVARAGDLESPTAHSLRLALGVASREHARLTKHWPSKAAAVGGEAGRGISDVKSLGIRGVCLPFLCSGDSGSVFPGVAAQTIAAQTIAALVGISGPVPPAIDFGPERTFAPLYLGGGSEGGNTGECVRLQVQGYEYAICAFANVTQAKVEEGGGVGMKVLLGKWEGWEQDRAEARGGAAIASDALLSLPSVQSLLDPSAPAAIAAPAGSLRALGYTRMQYTKGATCHGGNARYVLGWYIDT